jgi:hypothetical protein
MRPSVSLPCSQKPAIYPCYEPDESSPCLRTSFILILSSRLSSSVFHSSFPTKTLYAFSSSCMLHAPPILSLTAYVQSSANTSPLKPRELCLSALLSPVASFVPPPPPVCQIVTRFLLLSCPTTATPMWSSNRKQIFNSLPKFQFKHESCSIFPSPVTPSKLWVGIAQLPSGLRVKTHIQRSGAGRGGAERPAACDLIRGNKAIDLFPRIK